MPTTLRPLQIAYAQKELARLDHIRAVMAAHKDGASQTAIANDAGISQAEVSRILRRVEAVPAAIARSPREVILRHAAGQLDHASMLTELVSWNYSFAQDAQPENPLSVRTSGSWEQVTDALHRGLLSDDDFDYLLEHVRRSSADTTKGDLDDGNGRAVAHRARVDSSVTAWVLSS
ncbi:hypothetical protein HAV21_05870 [Paenarthrobacter sp. MSM-2-10-13]|uniref:hypothetical protein n=1 Tax=Micrococcaceae TaxID=1268 RepID=UPI00115E0B85|nr:MULTISPECIES: hypothetical protein [Micrococcaceae]MCM0616737.1 hypothetical protein [Paenarthrobacter sp. TYUT067]NHW46419.1 hypothetical protein [Paenarthrobacter sp. MSM-2-10-13]TQS93806.1 hypothetical protein EU811_03605 [Arthrobacter sp. TS-15]